MVVVECPLCTYETKDLGEAVVVELLKIHSLKHNQLQTQALHPQHRDHRKTIVGVQDRGSWQWWWPVSSKQSQTRTLPPEQRDHRKSIVGVQDRGSWQSQTRTLPPEQRDHRKTIVGVQNQGSWQWWWPVSSKQSQTRALPLEHPWTDEDDEVDDQQNQYPDFDDSTTTVNGVVSKITERKQWLPIYMTLAGVGWVLAVVGAVADNWAKAKAASSDNRQNTGLFTCYSKTKECFTWEKALQAVVLSSLFLAWSGVVMMGASLVFRGRMPWIRTLGGVACIVGGILIIITIILYGENFNAGRENVQWSFYFVTFGGVLFFVSGALVTEMRKDSQALLCDDCYV